MEIFQISIHNEIHFLTKIARRRRKISKMVTFIAQIPSFPSIMMYILGKNVCKTPADFGQISAGAGGLEFWPGPGTRSITGFNDKIWKICSALYLIKRNQVPLYQKYHLTYQMVNYLIIPNEYQKNSSK